ncbi:conserved repeat domain protein [Filimonas lacunae]|nr:conserved repeat domain protein [Filimonas lacunae]
MGATQAQNCTINAGVTTNLCPSDEFKLAGTSSGLIKVNAVWTQTGGPTVTIVTPNSLTSLVTGYAAGQTYKFKLTATCTDGSIISDEVTFNTLKATIADAGADMFVCPPSAQLNGNAVATGETGTWRISGDDNSMKLDAATVNLPNATVILPDTVGGVTVFRWTVRNPNGCNTFDDVTITNGSGVSPVTAGPDLTLSNCYTVTQGAYLKNASYGGNGTNGQEGTWSLVSGPSIPVFNDIHKRDVSVSQLYQGVYRFRWTVSGPCVNGADEIDVIVPAPTQSITASGSGEVTYCDNRTSTVLVGPSLKYANETITWSTIGGAGTIVTPNASTTTVNGLNGQESQFKYIVSNSVTGCTTSGVIKVKFSEAPGVSLPAIISPDCNTTDISINYTTTGGTLTQWAMIEGPANANIVKEAGLGNYYNTLESPLELSNFNISGDYKVGIKRTTYQGTGACPEATGYTTIHISREPTASNGGTKQVLACAVTETHLAGNVPTVGTGSWSQVGGPSVAVIADKNDPTTLVSGLTNGEYIFKWIVTGNVGCGNKESNVSVLVSLKTPTQADAGADATICANTPYTLNGNRPVLNESGTWTVTPSAGVTISEVTNPKTAVTGLQLGQSYTFTWTIANACSTTTDDVVITVDKVGPQAALAGSDLCLPAGTTSFSLSGNAPASNELGTWSVISGPGTLSFSNVNSYNATVSGVVNGTYQLAWTLSTNNGCTPAMDTIAATIANTATVPVVSGGGVLCGVSDLTLQGNQPTVGIGRWSQVSGPGGAIITDSTAATTTVTYLQEGTYTFRWTISNGACTDVSNYKEVSYRVLQSPTKADAGSGKEICYQTSTQLNAADVTIGSGIWSLVSGPSTPTFSSFSDPKATISNLQAGTYILGWATANAGECTSTSPNISIIVTARAKVDAAAINLCNASSTNLSGNSSSTGVWTQDGSSPAATLTTVSQSAAVASNLVPGTYKFVYTIAATANCATTSDVTTVTNSAPSSEPDAGIDFSICLTGGITTSGVTLAAVSPAVGTGTWSVDADYLPTGASPVFSDIHSNTSTISNLIAGTYILKWNVANGYCSDKSDVARVVVSAEPTVANAGADQVNGCSANIYLHGNTPTIGIGTWTLVSGPNTPTIDAPNQGETQVLNTIPGTYVFAWTTTNGACAASSDQVQIQVTSLPATTANANVAGTNTNLCNTSGSGGAFFNVIGTNPKASETGLWAFAPPSSANGAIISSPTTSFTSVSGLIEGNYKLVWSITNGSCVSSDTVRLVVSDQPTTADAGGTTSICLYSPLTLTAATTVTTGSGAWSYVSGPSTPVISKINQSQAVVSGLQSGSYNFQFTTSNGVCPSSTSYKVVNVEDCRIQVAKAAGTPVQQADGSFDVTFTFTVTNPNANADIANVQVTDDLSAAFPSPKTFTVKSVTATGSLVSVTNSAFNGKTDQNLLQSGAAIAHGNVAVITLVVNVKL